MSLKPRLSLKARLHLATIALVLTLVFILAGLNLHRSLEQTFREVQERAHTNTTMMRDFLAQRIDDRVMRWRPAPPRGLEETKQVWRQILKEDLLIPQLLQKAIARSPLVVDIMITDPDGTVLTASNPAHADAIAPNLPDYLEWQKKPIPERVWDIFRDNQDYGIRVPMAAIGDDQELFTIRVTTSNALMRDAVLPEIESIGFVSLMAIVVSILYTLLFSNLMLRPLARVGRTIDMIAAGEFSADPLRQDPGAQESREFADLQSKLGLLGQQVRGARQDADQLRGKIDQLLQKMEEVVLLFDENEGLIMAGRPAERFFNRTRNELMGCQVQELFPTRSAIGASIQTAVQFHKPLTDLLVRHKVRNNEDANFLLSVDWNAGQMLVTLRDAESRRALASHLDLSSRLASISRLTGGVAHEIKNPLNAIAINLEVLRSRLTDDSQEMREGVDVIAREISRLDRVVKTFLNFTRPIDVNLMALDIGETLREIGGLVTEQATKSGVKLMVITPESPTQSWADPDLFKQALLNIVVNGIEAMPDGGMLYLRLLPGEKGNNIEVEDRGPGIPESEQEKIFELYFTTKVKGSGIGLAVAYQAIQLMGGTLTIRSEVGSGTVFRIVLPAVTPDEDAVERTTEPSQTAGKN